MKLAFETTGISLPDLKKVIDGIDDPKFGIDLNLGAIAKTVGLSGEDIDPTQNILDWLEQFKSKITDIHMSGVHQRWLLDDRLDRCPFEMNNCINYSPILKKLRRIQYRGPVVLEIISRDANSIIRNCQSASKELHSYWQENGKNEY